MFQTTSRKTLTLQIWRPLLDKCIYEKCKSSINLLKYGVCRFKGKSIIYETHPTWLIFYFWCVNSVSLKFQIKGFIALFLTYTYFFMKYKDYTIEFHFLKET